MIKERRDENNKIITDIFLHGYIEHHNRDYALKLGLKINQVGLNVISFIFPKNDYPKEHEPIETEPMTNLEAYYFVKGFKFLKDRTGCC